MSLRDFFTNVSSRGEPPEPPRNDRIETPEEPPAGPGRRVGERRRAAGRRRGDKQSTMVPRLLLVEPHDDTRALYTTLFEDVGCAVYAVASGPEAIAIAHRRLPDVVVMEIAVPGADGFAILHALRQEPGTADVPAVVVTSQVHFGVPDRARESGATLVLSKPVTPDVLLGSVDELLDSTPPDRLVRRHLRRSLMALKKLGSRLDERAQERIRALIDRLQIAALAVDADGRYVAASAGAERLIGMSREELLGMSVTDAALIDVLPLAGPWNAFRFQSISTSAATMRDRTGQHVPMSVCFVTVVPGVDVAAFATEQGGVLKQARQHDMPLPGWPQDVRRHVALAVPLHRDELMLFCGLRRAAATWNGFKRPRSASGAPQNGRGREVQSMAQHLGGSR